MHFKTIAIHAEPDSQDHLGAVMPPIFRTSTFAFRGVGQPGPFDHSRSGNPTRKTLEECLAALEGGAFGFAFATGMAAEATLLMMFESGDTVAVHNDLYGGTYRLFETVFRGKQIRAVLARGAQAVWIESPTNPLMNLVDLEAVSRLAHEHGAIAICDNTFLSPYFQRPLEFGVDAVVHPTKRPGHLRRSSRLLSGSAGHQNPGAAADARRSRFV